MRCALVAFLACLALVSSWAQDPPSSSTDSPPAASALTSPKLSDIAARLLSLSTALSSEADAQSIELSELQSLLEESRTALESSQASLDKAAVEAKRLSAGMALWRVGALSGVIGLAGSLLDHEAARGAGIGAGIGAAAAAVWWAVEAWPPWMKIPKGKE